MLENCTTQCFFHPDFAAMLNAIWWPSGHALQLKCEEERTAMLWGTQAQRMGGRSKGSWARPPEPQPKAAGAATKARRGHVWPCSAAAMPRCRVRAAIASTGQMKQRDSVSEGAQEVGRVRGRGRRRRRRRRRRREREVAEGKMSD
jgi:hypothetical protein